MSHPDDRRAMLAPAQAWLGSVLVAVALVLVVACGSDTRDENTADTSRSSDVSSTSTADTADSTADSTADGTSGSPTDSSGTAAPVELAAGVDGTVGYLQAALHLAGHYDGPLDGVVGPRTSAALRAFQAEAGLRETGELDIATVDALAGSSTAAAALVVRALQTELTELGFFSGEIDGHYDTETTDAVRAFQAEAQLTVDGVVGPETLAALQRAHFEGVVTPALESSGSTLPPAPPEPVPDDGRMQPGDQGDHVRSLQQRLADLGYRPGAIDGNYGAETASAVLAFQKHEGMPRDSVAGPEVQARLAAPTGAGPQSTSGPRVEVDLDRQILFVIAVDGTVTIVNTSTGSGATYASPGGGSAVAYTPKGTFAVQRRVDGLEQAPLGTLYRPLYFTGGWAIHGSTSVPAYPASHGCVRTSYPDQDFVWAAIPNGAPVVVYGGTLGASTDAAPGF